MPVEFLWTFAVQELLKKALQLAAEQIVLARGFKNDLSKLRDSLLMVEAILRDVDTIKAEHHAVRLWVQKLEDIVFEADILLDEIAYEGIRRRVESKEEKVVVTNFIFPLKDFFVYRVKMAKKIKGIINALREHYNTASAVGLVAITSKETEFDLSQIRETDSLPDEFEVIGRETEVAEIVKQVIDLSNRGEGQGTLSVIPVVGMGGLGKTTLAKMVINHEVIKRHFDTTIWVCVSEPFVIKKILRDILETLKSSSGGLESKEALLKELRTLLHDEKYFLVLDDVWNENPSMWNELKSCLLKISRRSESSAVLVTTRSDEVAEIVETQQNSRHHLKKLSNDHCWSLFKQNAFGTDNPITPELEVFREKLVRKFGGIPLVVKVLGGIVKFDKNHEGLQSLLKSLIRESMSDHENNVLSTIKLSVHRLPSSLKQCFVYCSNFDKDSLFIKEELIRMWMAQGFLQPSEGSNETMEDIGDKYFNVLLSHSLFQDAVKDKRGRILYCKMHDLIHDIACAISNSSRSQIDSDNFLDRKHCSNERPLTDKRRKFHIVVYNPWMLHNEIMEFVYLRVLIIEDYLWDSYKLPDSIGKLKHLRYLDISSAGLVEYPESIVALYNLQTLKLGSKMPIDLPKKFSNLVHLRHFEFYFDPSDQTRQMPQHLGRLIQLQTLSSFIVGFDKGRKIEELGSLKKLRGALRLLRLERVKDKEEAMAAKMEEKDKIFYLCFQWSLKGERDGRYYNDFDVLEGLQPHKNLHVLTIRNFAGELLPNGIFVENLVEIYLHDCERIKTLPMLGHLSKLEILEIHCAYSVLSIGDEFYGNYHNKRALFPKLKTFHMFEMNSLERWDDVKLAVSDSGTIFPRLENLSIICCPKLTNIPDFFASRYRSLEVDDVIGKSNPSFQSGTQSLRSLKMFGCEKLTKLPNWLEFCTSLETLWISSCYNLNSTPTLENMHNLSSLRIRDLQKLPEGIACLTSLKELSIHGRVQDYEWSPFAHLTSLENLVLADMGISGATELPQQLKHLTALRSLHISLFDSIEVLPEWLGNLTSLETLKLYNWGNLKHLPSKEAMLDLTKLTTLRICGCPQLRLGKGEQEWSKISHVHSIYDISTMYLA